MRSGCAVACGWCGSASAYGYAASQRVRKRIEEAFGWIKSVAGLRQTPGDQEFESISLQRGVCELSVPKRNFLFGVKPSD